MIPQETPEFQMNSAIQQEQIDMQSEADRINNAPLLMQQQQTIQAALIEQINPANVLKDIRLKLRGEIEEPLSHEIISQGEPLMNEKGIAKMLLITSGVVNQNTIMSALNEKEINSLILNVLDDVIEDLTLNWKEYEIKYKTNLDTIHNIIANTAYLSLKRALNGGERTFLGKTTVESINSSPRGLPQKKGGFFSHFKL